MLLDYASSRHTNPNLLICLHFPHVEFTWKFSVKTAEAAGSEDPPAPSTARRMAVLYGDLGKTELLVMDSTDDNLYQPGFTNEFQVRSMQSLPVLDLDSHKLLKSIHMSLAT